MKTQKQILAKIQEIEAIINEAETTGKSDQINTFSELRKFKTRLTTLYWVIEETRRTLVEEAI